MVEFFRRLYYIFLYLLAAVTLTAAILVTLIRLALPGIGEYREDIQIWMTDYMGLPVEIEKLDANWEGWVPHLYLHEIQILDEEKIESIADFNSAHITIDLISSVEKRQIVPKQLDISGMDLTLIRKEDGSINVSKTEAEMDEKQIASNALAIWLLKQRKISMSKTQITLLDKTRRGSSPVLLSNVSLTLRSNSYRLQIEGNAQLPANFGDRINFALDAHGDILTPQWSGELYLEGISIYPPTWFEGEKILNTQISSAPGNIKLWSDWANAKVRNIDVLIDVEDVTLQSDDARFDINHLVAGFSIKRRVDKGLDLILDIDTLTTANGEWPGSTISISKNLSNNNEQYRYLSQISYLKLDDISHFMKVFPELLSNITFLEQMELHGDLTDSIFIYDPSLPENEKFFIDTDISLLGAKNNSRDATINGLSGHLRGNANRGKSSIKSESIKFNQPALFEKPLSFFELSGDIQWHREDDDWIVSTKQLMTHTADFDAELRGKIVLDPNTISSSFADLALSISDADIESVSNYLPLVMNERTRTWIDNALVSGNITSTDVILRGILSDIPFYNSKGRFVLVANIENVLLDYHPVWVPIDGIDAEIKIDGSKLTVTASSGKIYDADITNVIGTIEDLGADDIVIDVNGQVKGNTKDATLLVKNSPLAKNFTLNEIINNDINGDIYLDLGLNIPLNKKDITVKGKVSLQDTSLHSQAVGIKLDNINGEINFTKNTITGSDISANYFDQPVTLGIKSSDKGLVDFTLDGNTDNDFIVSQLIYFFPTLASIKQGIDKRIHGACQWRAVLSRQLSDNKLQSRKLKISSSLNGLSLDLPVPLGKTSETILLEISTDILESASTQIFDFKYGDVLAGILEIDENKIPKLKKALLSFGSQQILSNSGDGITVIGHIDQFNTSEWLDFINLQEPRLKESLTNNININVDIASLSFINQTFSNVLLDASKSKTDWIVDIKSDNINGEIKIPDISGDEPVNMIFDRFSIDEGQSETEHTFDPRNIPPLHVRIKSFQYSDVNLGKLSVSTTKYEDGMKIDKFSFIKNGLDISGNGIWKLIEGQNSSAFDITLNAEKLDIMLKTFGYSVTSIKEGKTTLVINANWDDTPANFSLDRLSGSISMNIDKGELLDVEPSAGRLFGLLSIQTLPRRLSLE